MSNKKDKDVVKAATQLLANRHRYGTEGNVQSNVEALLRAMEIGTIESHYQLGSDQADIYLPNRRTFIECKSYPKAEDPEKSQSRKSSESPREQVDRYVRAEIENEMQVLPGLSMGESSGPWVGIVTDGAHWHVYEYPNEVEAIGSLASSKAFINESDALATFLTETLGSEMVGKEWIPEKPGELFSDLKDELDDLYRMLPKKAAAPTLTKRQLWLDMMKTSGMVPEDDAGQERLFLAHSFLIVVTRLVSHTLSGSHRGDEWTLALRDGFASWVLDFSRGQRWAGQVWNRVDGYDWRRRRGDVLRDLYHRYVSQQDRKVFGEFYTPDWLAALMVEEVLDDKWIQSAAKAVLNSKLDGVGVLDPACGSGTFLYHAALRILASPSVKALRPVERANVVANLVNGMDIHPVAVEIARVNIERALPSEPTEGASAYRVFLGDSLQVDTRGELLFGHTEEAMRLTTPSGRQALIPMDLVQDPSFAEIMRQIVNAATEMKALPPSIANKHNRAALESCHKDLTEIIKAEGNSVWTWYAINLAGPHLLAKRKINRIVANPPWVKLSDIQVKSRKRTMEEFGRSLGLQAGGKLAPHLDIASYFVLQIRKLYMADPTQDPGSWLVKKSAIRSGQWALFRSAHKKTLAQTVDLEKLNPFNGGDATRCCLLMEHRPMRGMSSPRIEAKLNSQRKPSAHETLDSARGRFEFIEVPEFSPQAPSAYKVTSFKQGATIVPHVLAFIESQTNASRPGWTHVETRTSRHRPWDDIPSQRGQVPAVWVRPVHTSRDLLPYVASKEPPHAIIPIDMDGKIHSEPGDDCQFWMELDEIYDAHKGHGQGTPETLIKRFNYAAGLSRQPLKAQRGRSMVLYPTSADIMRAARSHAGMAVVDASLYWTQVDSEAEAGFLVALLNARCLRRAFSECRESGRHFHLHPWRKVPIPRYDGRIRKHRRLAELCSAAEKIAARRVEDELKERPTLGQQGLSQTIRAALQESKFGREIERIASELLPDQAD